MRVALIGLLLVAATGMTGCLDGGFGVCVGQETPLKYIRDDQCPRWIIEVDHVSGMAPDQASLDLLKSRLDSLVNKESITIIVDDTSLSGRDTWTSAQLATLERETRDHHTESSTITTHVLYVDGELSGASSVVGFAHGHRYVVMFKENIQDATNSVLVSTTASQFERAVLIHEFGHILGLVDNGLPMQTDHEADTCQTGNGERADEGHSSNENSVMFCTVESTAFFDLFGDTQPPTQFDANDRRDICAAGGKC